jgi:hypothetical protein
MEGLPPAADGSQEGIGGSSSTSQRIGKPREDSYPHSPNVDGFEDAKQRGCRMRRTASAKYKQPSSLSQFLMDKGIPFKRTLNT